MINKKIMAFLCLIVSLANAGEALESQAENSIFALLSGAETFIERAFKVDPQTALGKKYVHTAVGFVKQDDEPGSDFLNRMRFTLVARRTPNKNELFQNEVQNEIVDFLEQDLKKRMADQVFTMSVLDAFNRHSALEWQKAHSNNS